MHNIMTNNEKWQQLGWRHPFWDVLRYYRSIRGRTNSDAFYERIVSCNDILHDNKNFQVPREVAEIFKEYFETEQARYNFLEAQLRLEDEALSYCVSSGFQVGTTSTQSRDHHQSSKSMIASVSGIAQRVCGSKGIQFDPDPQNRCVWINDNRLHVTSRNLDGAIPGLTNPEIIWEIKEYWGKTKGGSKMSDAVYECQLVGRELREYEEKCNKKIMHFVFLDGKDQWSHRKSDLKRFIDLWCQGLIDTLFVGKQVESLWEKTLEKLL
ncbi:hypothetical protein Mmc1_1280 [Magnetococcus marinus MC-1]|uniref:DUF7687 domain-containing protein n=2 Tax=Magnetococcus TaxID=162171 RepID=A0L748_MAGMM|nr:hypothetical protein Mmc1_1280 [Magnetococcus marinus MC-1]